MKSLYDKHWEADKNARTHGDVCDNHVAITLEFAKNFAAWIKHEGIYATQNKKLWIIDSRDSKDYTTDELITLYQQSLTHTNENVLNKTKMTDTIRVKILEDGIHAKEQNPYQHPEALDSVWDMKRKRWSEAETSLRTFEIEGQVLIAGNNIRLQNIMKNQRDQLHVPYEFLKDKTFEAELLPNNKIKILP